MKILQYLFISLSHKLLKLLPYTWIRKLSVPIGTLYFFLTFRSSIKLFKRKEIFNELKINYDILFTQNVCNKKKSKMKDELYVK